MGADFTTAFKRKASDFEKRKAKPTKKAKKIKKEESSTSSSSNEAVSKFHEWPFPQIAVSQSFVFISSPVVTEEWDAETRYMRTEKRFGQRYKEMF